MASFVMLLITLLMLSTPFSSCAPQDTAQDTAVTARPKARIFYADACTLSQKRALDALVHNSEEIFDAQGDVSFPAR